MNPTDYEAYNSLGHILWKKKDFKGSKNCYEESLNKQKNKEALRNLSIILRSTGEGEEYRKNVELSVKQAKDAMMLDLKDPQSWCKKFYGLPKQIYWGMRICAITSGI